VTRLKYGLLTVVISILIVGCNSNDYNNSYVEIEKKRKLVCIHLKKLPIWILSNNWKELKR